MMIQCQFGNTQKIWASKRKPDMLVAHLNGRFIANSGGSQFPICCIKKYEKLNNTFEWNDWYIYTLSLNVKPEALLLTIAKWYRTNKTSWRRVRNDSKKWKNNQPICNIMIFFLDFFLSFFGFSQFRKTLKKLMCKLLQRLTVGATLDDCKWRSHQQQSACCPDEENACFAYLLINAF